MRTERMSIKEFMNRKESPSVAWNVVKFGTFLPLTVFPLTTIKANAATYNASPVAAMSSDQIYDKMLTAFEPITTLIQALAYPVASVCVLVGAILIMVRAKDKGLEMISNAGLGIILVNILPLLLNLLVEIMKGIV